MLNPLAQSIFTDHIIYFLFVFSRAEKERKGIWEVSCVLWISFVDVLRLSVYPVWDNGGELFLLFRGLLSPLS